MRKNAFKFLLLTISTLVLLIIAALAVPILMESVEDNPRCTWKTNCKSKFLESKRCISWDESFQDNYYFSWHEGTPGKSLCEQFKIHDPKLKKSGSTKNWCGKGDPAYFTKIKCPSYVDADQCYLCEFRHSGDEAHEVVLGFKEDCSTGFSVESTGGGLQTMRTTQMQMKSGC